MPDIPRDPNPDSTLALLSEGYQFISNRCERFGSDIFQTRLLLKKAICVLGEEAAAMFYQDSRFTRVGAMPPTTLKLLQDKGSVQQLDGAAHHHRKQMFMSLMTPPAIDAITAEVANQWHAFLAKWEQQDQVVLHNEVEEILCRAVCNWAGVPLTHAESAERTREIRAMIEGAGSVGPRTLEGLVLRQRTEKWAQKHIEDVRNGRLQVPEERALHVIATYEQPNGQRLNLEDAAVEVLNILRPTVAIARYITFCALALHEYPETRQWLQAGADGQVDDMAVECFVQEVRRYYPFFPFIGGRVLEAFEWRGHHFAPGEWVILDLYGTNHDSRTWADPHLFQPERFRTWQENAFNFVPQGGGDYYTTHRCPGEWITIAVTKTAARLLANAMTYGVPPQDLSVNLATMPALPKSRFVIQNVRRA